MWIPIWWVRLFAALLIVNAAIDVIRLAYWLYASL